MSDAFAGSLWWIDELGLAARTGHRVVVRQALVGSDYGLLDAETLEPRPDYEASLLWKRTMGTKVLAVKKPAAPRVRVYAHCAAGGAPGAVALALVNLDRAAPADVAVPWSLDGAEATIVTAPSLDSRAIVQTKQRVDGALRLPPLSYALAVFPAAGVPACRAGP